MQHHSRRLSSAQIDAVEGSGGALTLKESDSPPDSELVSSAQSSAGQAVNQPLSLTNPPCDKSQGKGRKLANSTKEEPPSHQAGATRRSSRAAAAKAAGQKQAEALRSGQQCWEEAVKHLSASTAARLYSLENAQRAVQPHDGIACLEENSGDGLAHLCVGQQHQQQHEATAPCYVGQLQEMLSGCGPLAPEALAQYTVAHGPGMEGVNQQQRVGMHAPASTGMGVQLLQPGMACFTPNTGEEVLSLKAVTRTLSQPGSVDDDLRSHPPQPLLTMIQPRGVNRRRSSIDPGAFQLRRTTTFHQPQHQPLHQPLQQHHNNMQQFEGPSKQGATGLFGSLGGATAVCSNGATAVQHDNEPCEAKMAERQDVHAKRLAQPRIETCSSGAGCQPQETMAGNAPVVPAVSMAVCQAPEATAEAQAAQAHAALLMLADAADGGEASQAGTGKKGRFAGTAAVDCTPISTGQHQLDATPDAGTPANALVGLHQPGRLPGSYPRKRRSPSMQARVVNAPVAWKGGDDHLASYEEEPPAPEPFRDVPTDAQTLAHEQCLPPVQGRKRSPPVELNVWQAHHAEVLSSSRGKPSHQSMRVARAASRVMNSTMPPLTVDGQPNRAVCQATLAHPGMEAAARFERVHDQTASWLVAMIAGIYNDMLTGE